MFRWLLAASVIVAFTSVAAGERRTYSSPDRTHRAIIVPVSRTGESRVEIRLAASSLRFAKSYWSSDGEHGWIVGNASWSANSRFFVFNLQSSGGHQPWHSPIFYYDRRTNKLSSVDDQIGSITSPEFTIEPPDIVVAIGRRKADLEEEKFRVRLSHLIKP